MAGTANANLVSQAKLNKLVVGFITEGLMLFSVVEMPSFKALVTGLFGLLADDSFLELRRIGLIKKHWNERVPL